MMGEVQLMTGRVLRLRIYSYPAHRRYLAPRFIMRRRIRQVFSALLTTGAVSACNDAPTRPSGPQLEGA